jgi:hypothetical protein
MVYKQNEWTEESLLALSTEDDRFDKKSGSIFPSDFKKILAKAVSAFANSNGGHIIIGMCDERDRDKNGRDFDGVNFKPKKVSFCEWLEDQISGLVTPPIQNYRVLPVKSKSKNSQIQKDKPVYVIEIEASEIAPHQSNVDKVYYYREGNDSQPATHYYLEGLRSVRRFISPDLVRAWLDTFLLKLNQFFKEAAAFYQKRDFFPYINDSSISKKFSFKIEYTGDNLFFYTQHLNADQFLRRFPRFQTKFEEYKKLSEKFNIQSDLLKNSIANSTELHNFLFKKFIKSDNFSVLLTDVGIELGHDKLENRQRRLFELCSFSPTVPKKEFLNMIAGIASCELLSSIALDEKANRLTDKSPVMKFIRLWNVISKGIYESIIPNLKISKSKKNCELALVELSSFVNELSNELDTEIDLLTSRSGVPYISYDDSNTGLFR